MFKRIFGLLFFVVLLLWSEFSDPCFTLFTLKAQEETKEVIPEPYEKGIPVETLSTLRSLFNELNHFPKPEAKKACKKLLEYGDMVIPIVDHYLRNGNWREKTAMAFIAQDLQSKALLRSLNYAAQDPEIKDLQYFFEAFLSSDLLPGQHLILQFLKHSKSSVRWLATRTLLPVLQPDLKEPLFELLESKEISDKTNIIRLLGTYRDPKVIPYFTKYLNHANPETCIQASQELSRFNHEELIQILMGNLNHSDFRLKGYSVLTLVALQDQFKVQLFDEDAYLAFLKDLRSLQDFIRFIAAIALSTINQSDLDITFKEEDEQALLQALIDACMGNRYFKDYQAVRSVGLEKLQKLTGKNFRADPVEWKKWWDSHKGSFHLLKKLRSVSPSQVETVQVFYQTEGNQTRTFLFSVKAVESLVQDFPLAQVRILANSEMMELTRNLKKWDFLL
jgi:hypothetical protein